MCFVCELCGGRRFKFPAEAVGPRWGGPGGGPCLTAGSSHYMLHYIIYMIYVA